MNILFVCTGNTCRSPMAEGYFRHLCRQAEREGLHVASAGTFASEGAPVSDASARVLAGLGIDISGHRSSQLTVERIRDADIVIAMTRSHRSQVLDFEPGAIEKTHLLLDFAGGSGKRDIPDPIGGNDSIYQDCFDAMKGALENLFLDVCSKRRPLER